jgi:hypothetical protein
VAPSILPAQLAIPPPNRLVTTFPPDSQVYHCFHLCFLGELVLSCPQPPPPTWEVGKAQHIGTPLVSDLEFRKFLIAP